MGPPVRAGRRLPPAPHVDGHQQPALGEEALQEGAEGGAGGEGLHALAVDPQEGAQAARGAARQVQTAPGTARSGSGQSVTRSSRRTPSWRERLGAGGAGGGPAGGALEGGQAPDGLREGERAGRNGAFQAAPAEVVHGERPQEGDLPLGGALQVRVPLHRPLRVVVIGVDGEPAVEPAVGGPAQVAGVAVGGLGDGVGDGLRCAQRGVEGRGGGDALPRALQGEEVQRGRADQDGAGGDEAQQVGVVEPGRELPQEVLLGVAGGAGAPAPFQGGDVAAGDGDGDALVEGRGVGGVRPAPGVAGHRQAGGVHLGAGGEVVDPPEGVPDHVLGQVDPQQKALVAGVGVLGGAAPEGGAPRGGVPVEGPLALADGVVGEDEVPLGGQPDAHPLVGLARPCRSRCARRGRGPRGRGARPGGRRPGR